MAGVVAVRHLFDPPSLHDLLEYLPAFDHGQIAQALSKGKRVDALCEQVSEIDGVQGEVRNVFDEMQSYNPLGVSGTEYHDNGTSWSMTDCNALACGPPQKSFGGVPKGKFTSSKLR